MNVPKIIWQTHNYEFEELPDHLKKVTKNWINLNPGWEYRYVSHTERLEKVKQYPKLMGYYEKQNPATQSDIWRFIVTYEYGGVYCDMDSVCIKPLNYLLNTVNDCEMLVVPSSHNPGSPTNTANYAIKQHSKIMKDIINYTEKHVNAQLDQYKHPWTCFMDIVKISDNILYEFTSAWHTMEFKTFFDANFWVDDYGTSIKYEDFLKKYDLSII